MKFATIPINSKQFEVRRVLISYKRVKSDGFTRIYKGTKFIDACDYLKDNTRSHVYKFEDDGYYTLKAESIDYTPDQVKQVEEWKTQKRPYHGSCVVIEYFPKEFEADTVEEAIAEFHKFLKEDAVIAAERLAEYEKNHN